MPKSGVELRDIAKYRGTVPARIKTTERQQTNRAVRHASQALVDTRVMAHVVVTIPPCGICHVGSPTVAYNVLLADVAVNT